MPKVDMISFVHHRDYMRLAQGDELPNRIASHNYPFDNVIVIRQRLRYEPGADLVHFPYREIETEDHPDILKEYGIPEDDPIADDKTHGPTAPHYWKWHCINHLIGLKVSDADYIVFSDSDCRMKHQPKMPSWVEAGIDILKNHGEALIVSPSDGGQMHEKRIKTRVGLVRLTQNVSQQIFVCERARLKGINFAIPWNWEFTAPGGPFQEFYYMLEGRIWRYMHHNGLYRAILPAAWRYWHDQW